MKKNEILSLIQTSREGEYWDFKAEYPKNNANLLHDIICLSNNLDNREAYLIIGVTDGGYVKGVKDDPNRRNQEELISFVNGKSFAGDRYPYIELSTLTLKDKEIDVIIISPKGYAPYYLSQSYSCNKRTVNAGSIYTRTGDKNTDIDKTANPTNTELLWKIHFGLYPSPLKKLKRYLLFSDGWIKNEERYFYNEAPEYTIAPNTNIEEKENYENLVSPFYAYVQTNNNSHYSYYECKYHNTVLFSSQCISLDSGQYLTPVPEFSGIKSNYTPYDSLYYRYFIKDTTLYNMHLFMYEEQIMEQTIARNKFLDCILIFESEEEREWFEFHATDNFFSIKQAIECDAKEVPYVQQLEQKEREDITDRITTSLILKRELEKYRKIK